MINDVEKEAGDIEAKIKRAVAIAVPQLGEYLKKALAEKIEENVYAKYDPEFYERRSENPSLGTPLTDMEKNAELDISGNTITLTYLPTGEHANSSWGWHSGDALIEWLENPYGRGAESVPGRPFWDEFINEQILGGKAAKAFTDAINAADPTIALQPGSVSIEQIFD